MSLRELPSLVQGTDEWHDQRRGIVTASVVGKLLSTRGLTAIDYTCPSCDAAPNDPCRSKVKRGGEIGAPIKTLHPERADVARNTDSPTIVEPAYNDTADDVTRLLTAERITGWTDPTYVSDDMLRGIEDEPRVRDLYSERYAPVREIGFMIRDDWGYPIGYSPDGLVGDDGLIEIKSRRQKTQLSTIVNNTVPPENMAQLQCGLLVSGRQWIDYVSYCGGMPMYVTRVLPDEKWHEAIVEAVRIFEQNAAEMIATYRGSIDGLHTTERIIEEEMVI